MLISAKCHGSGPYLGHIKERAEGALNDVVEKRKSRVVWYPVERHVNVHPMMAASAEELASQGL
jgi:hypothetical protein